jgi:hypothetical protein
MTLELRVPKIEPYEFKIKVLKYWTYDVDRLYKENLYLLYPIYIFKLRKAMERVYRSKKSAFHKKVLLENLHKELIDAATDAGKAIDKAYKDGKIELDVYNEMGTILTSLNAYLVNVYGLPKEYDEEVEAVIKTLYDPKVEARGKFEGKFETLIKQLQKKFGSVDEAYVLKMKQSDISVLDNLLNDIFDLTDIKDIEKYLN